MQFQWEKSKNKQRTTQRSNLLHSRARAQEIIQAIKINLKVRELTTKSIIISNCRRNHQKRWADNFPGNNHAELTAIVIIWHRSKFCSFQRCVQQILRYCTERQEHRFEGENYCTKRIVLIVEYFSQHCAVSWTKRQGEILFETPNNLGLPLDFDSIKFFVFRLRKLRELLNGPQMAQKLAAEGSEPAERMTPDQFKAYFAREYEEVERQVQQIKVKLY